MSDPVSLSPTAESDDETLQARVAALEARARALEAERERAEEALRAQVAAHAESEARLRAVADLVPDLLWRADAGGAATWFNQRWMEYTGQTPEEALGFGWREALHPDDREPALGGFRAGAEAGAATRQERRLRGADGVYRWFLVQAQPVRDEQGRITEWFGAVTDVDEQHALLEAERVARAEADAARREADAVRQESERSAQVTRMVTTHMADGVCVMDARGRLSYMNPAAERILGWTEAELRGDILHDRVHYLYPDGRPFPLHECPLGQVLSAGRAVLGMVDQWVRKDGSFVHLVTTCSPLLSEGRVVGAVLSMHDDTERRQAEAERERLLRAEQAAREDAEAANRTKGEFLAVMSHELRTPLNAIGGHAELLEMGVHGPVNQAQSLALGRIQLSQRHLLGLINEVLNYAKLETGSVRYDIGDVPVAAALASVEALVEPQMRAKGLALSVACRGGELVVRADVEKLRQILLNLLGNAVKFTDPGGRIDLACDEDGDGVRIAVRDSGVGIAADKLETIFEPFVQVGRALNSPGEGAGLGLAISRDLARGMGGDLTVHSTPGEGSTFTLRLPRGGGGGGINPGMVFRSSS